MADSSELRRRLRHYMHRTMLWGRDRVPAGLRTLLGILFCIGGVFWFLPVLGLWMWPLGLALIALDVPPLRPRIDRWIDKLGRDESHPD